MAKGGSSKTKNWAGVINFPENDSLAVDRIPTAFESLADIAQFRFALIVHDSDTREDGSKKIIHMHFLIWDTLATTKSGMLSFLATQLHLDEKLISLEPSYRDSMSVCYLVHKYNPEKFQYLPSSIVTNCRAKIDNLLNVSVVQEDNHAKLSDKQVVQLIKDNISFSGLVELLGVVEANKWRHAYRLIKQDLSNGLDTKNVRLNYCERV